MEQRRLTDSANKKGIQYLKLMNSARRKEIQQVNEGVRGRFTLR
jgi:hypothetical protein